MKENFDACMAYVFTAEGGYVNNPSDPGGATNLGITLATARRYIKLTMTAADLRKLTKDQAAAIYRKQYWDVVRGDDLPSGVDYAVYDYAVNSGPGRAASVLRTIAGMKAATSIDAATVAAVRLRRPVDVIDAIDDERLAYLQRLSTWRLFGAGWTSRVTAVTLHAVKMAAAGAGVPLSPPALTVFGGAKAVTPRDKIVAPLASPAVAASAAVSTAAAVHWHMGAYGALALTILGVAVLMAVLAIVEHFTNATNTTPSPAVRVVPPASVAPAVGK